MLIRSVITDCPKNVRVGPQGQREYIKQTAADVRRFSFNRNDPVCKRCGKCFEGSGVINRSRADGQQFWPDPGREKVYDGAPGEF